MRNPVRSETDAFHLVYGCAALIGVSVVLGALVSPLVGVALFAGGLIGALLWEIATQDPARRQPLRDAAFEGRRVAPTTTPKVLIVANRTLAGEELRAELRRHASAGAELYIVAPILASRVHYVASDVDKELADARERLAAALAWARSEAIQADGHVGDANAAFGVIEDALRVFAADEVIVSTHPPGKSNWLETGIVGRLREELDIPVTHVTVDLERAGASH
jgi:hypothetical protein